MSKSKKMGVIQLTTVTAINMMGSGIILLPSKLAEIGTVSIFAWILASLGATLLAYAFSVCGMYGTKSGGMGGYAEYRFGRIGNFLSNYAYAICRRLPYASPRSASSCWPPPSASAGRKKRDASPL